VSQSSPVAVMEQWTVGVYVEGHGDEPWVIIRGGAERVRRFLDLAPSVAPGRIRGCEFELSEAQAASGVFPVAGVISVDDARARVAQHLPGSLVTSR
jgi:hypothetical protein